MMTKMKLALVLCGTLLSGVAAAQPAGKDTAKWSEMKQKHAEMRKQQLAKFDTNKDGKLDEQERAAKHDEMATQLFAKLDTNKDGSISLAELKAAKHGAMGRRGFGHHRGGGKRGFHGSPKPASK